MQPVSFLFRGWFRPGKYSNSCPMALIHRLIKAHDYPSHFLSPPQNATLKKGPLSNDGKLRPKEVRGEIRDHGGLRKAVRLLTQTELKCQSKHGISKQDYFKQVISFSPILLLPWLFSPSRSIESSLKRLFFSEGRHSNVSKKKTWADREMTNKHCHSKQNFLCPPQFLFNTSKHWARQELRKIPTHTTLISAFWSRYCSYCECGIMYQ